MISADGHENVLPEVLKSSAPYDDGWARLNKDELRFPDGSEGPRIWLELQFPFVCNIVPTLPSGDLVFIEVYRHPVRRWLLELPGGLGEEGETPDVSAQRELKEETGLDTKNLTSLGKVNVDPGLLSHDTYVFRAENCTGWNAGHTDSADQIRGVVSLSLDEVERRIAAEDITHGPTLIALYLDRLSRTGGH
ncbi:MAG: NUDIX hydrolase [Chloroflexi bacterium]|nr:NUDIX hydrolase [Chloroflexota bacterium]MBT4513688.1 NUDIX hydrolase [Chloroflexota bacterium]